MTQPRTPAKVPSDLPALAAAFLLVIGFTFSDDVVEFLLDVTGHPHSAGRAGWCSRSISCWCWAPRR